MKIMVYDAEIIRAIPGKEAPLEGVDYCAGWGDFEHMGVSVIAAYVWGLGYRIFLADNIQDFKALAEDPEILCVGFNNRAFDDILVERALGITIPMHRSWDLLRAVRLSRGQHPNYAPGGPNLDSLCKANALPGKSGSGPLAPILWQRGQMGQVIDYALNDVIQTKKLVALAIAGRLRDHESGCVLTIAMPSGFHDSGEVKP